MSSVYLIQCMGFVKIGMSSNIKARLDALQTANPHPLKLIDSIYCGSSKSAHWLESIFHSDLTQYRVNMKSEWFAAEKEVFSYFQSAKERYPEHEVNRWVRDYEAILEARALSESRNGFIISAKTHDAEKKYPFGFKCWETRAFYPPEEGAADYFTENAINFCDASCRI